jgi:hypothetical protein
MIQFAKNLAFATAFAVLAAAPAHAFVGYGVEAGTPMYDALQHGYQPQLEGRHYYYYTPPQRRWRRAPRPY